MWRTTNHYNAKNTWVAWLHSPEKHTAVSSFPRRLKELFYANEWIDLILANKIDFPSLDIARQVFSHHFFSSHFSSEQFDRYYTHNPRFFREQYRCWWTIAYWKWAAWWIYAPLIVSFIDVFIEKSAKTFTTASPSFNTLISSDKNRLWVFFSKIISCGADESVVIEQRYADPDFRKDILRAMHPSYGEDLYSDDEFSALVDTKFSEKLKNPL